MGKQPKETLGKRNRDHAKKMKQQDKEARRALRKAEKTDRPPLIEGEDPDLVGLRLGPQPPPF